MSLKKIFEAMKYFSYGLQFTAIVIVPFIVCIFIGGYLQNKYKLGDWIMILSIIIALVLMISDLFSFGKIMLRKLNDEKRGKRND